MRFSKLSLLAPFIGLAALAAGVLPASSQAPDIKERTLRLSSANNKGHPQVIGAEKFADLVAQKSGGKITVRLFPGGTLGPDLQNISAMQGGTLDFIIGNVSLLAGNVKEMLIFELPYLFGTAQEADAVVDGPIGKKLFDKLPAKSLVGLAYWELGFRQFHTKKPVNKAADIERLKIRAFQTPVYIDFIKAAGANGVPMPFTETYTALEQGAVDGMTNPLINMVDGKFYEVTKNVTITNHIYNPQWIGISKRTWDKLSDDEKKLIQEAATEATAVQRQASREADAKSLEFLKSKGVTVTTLSPEETEKLRAKAQPVIEKYTKELGPELIAEIQAEIEKVRAKK